jgi:hypothetical protein
MINPQLIRSCDASVRDAEARDFSIPPRLAWTERCDPNQGNAGLAGRFSASQRGAYGRGSGIARGRGDALRDSRGGLPPHAVDGVLAAYKKEDFALAGTARAVELAEQAIRGETFVPKL